MQGASDVRQFIAVLVFAALLLGGVGCVASPDRQIGSDGGDERQETMQTQQPQQPQQRTLTFLFFSDTQPNPELMDYSSVGELLAQAVSREELPELVVFGGDTVDDGGCEEQWGKFRQAIGSSLDGILTAAVAGNHDSYALLAEQFDYPQTAPSSPGEGFFYTFSMGPVFFVMLDSNIMGAANERDIMWLENELQSESARQADWLVAVMHHPVWTVSDTPRDMRRSETLREHFLPILEENGVALILCGHQHIYTRTKPMRGDAVAHDGRGIVQIMAASGDKASYTMGERDFIAADHAAPNYLLISADSASISITAYDGEHRMIDQFAIQRYQ